MPILAALASGLLLFVSDHPLRLWWLQMVAFLPFWWALALRRGAARSVWPLGLVLGLGNVGPLCIVAGVDPPILALAAVNVAQWSFAAPWAARLLAAGPVRGPLAAAALLTLVEVAVWHLVPLFGTAQCFARPLSAAPALCAFVAFTGVGGLVFVLLATQALVVQARQRRIAAPAVATAALVAVAAALSWHRWTRPLGPERIVATLGWGHDADRFHTAPGELVAEAKARGATLLVTPETGVASGHVPRERTLGWLAGLAKTNALALAVGVWHGPTNDNRIWFFDATGELRGEYAKTHLIPWLEDYVAGDGTLHHGDLAGTSLGGMICQDDNFTDLARGYGRAGTRLVAVPTNDWESIRGFHLENSVYRAIENGYAVARAASGGISALVSPRGEIVQQLDHFASGEGLLVGPLATGDAEPTFYAWFGDLPLALLCALLVGAGLLRREPGGLANA
ncbi:MAG: hypothetical protein IPK26_04120 [Planctomycetes bacterium]|nr:hypothetical protein [Planctomycetota bacterium]